METLTHSLTESEQGNIEQHKRDLATFENWRKKKKKKSFCALYYVKQHVHLLGEFKEYPTSQEIWKALRSKHGGTSATRLRTDHEI